MAADAGPLASIPSGPAPAESDRYLTQDERIVIADGIRAGLSRRAIAALLPGRAVSTVCGEVTRNRDQDTGDYRPHAAHHLMLRRRPRPKPRSTDRLLERVAWRVRLTRLVSGWRMMRSEAR